VRTGFTLTDTKGEAHPDAAATWLPAVVPGGVHESLLAAGVLDDPYYGTNEDDARWVEERTWWYRTAFAGPGDLQPGERLTLLCHGLDGVATVWLYGRELGTHVNQHRPAAFEVTAAIAPTNELLVRFTPPLDGLLTTEELDGAVEELLRIHRKIRPGAEDPDRDGLAQRLRRTRRRKAAFSWGWDFALRLPSIGLHRPVELVRTSDARIAGTYARTRTLDLETGRASVVVDVEVDSAVARADLVRVSLTSPSGIVTVADAGAADQVSLELTVTDVEPWWTHDLGDQPLYDLRTELLRDDAVVAERVERIGIRTVELDRSPDQEGGRHFRFVLNGVPLFARGANWVPLSLLVGSVVDSRYRSMVDLARRGSMNMLRVWGGGIYEPDVFFDACDEQGVLVWQDFMFACDDYPSDDPDLREETRLEAEHQVRRLRSRASLALWAGNNEVQLLHQYAQGDLEPGNWGWSLFHEVLPEVVGRLSPDALYWPGSPWGEASGEKVNGVTDGDRHAWEVWHGIDLGAGGPAEYGTRGEAVHFHRYAYDHGRFISEFGIHAAPEQQTLQRWIPATDLVLRSPGLDHHNKDTPPDKGWALMEHEIGLPTTIEEYVDFSMACQAEGMKFGVEHYRRRQPVCGGTLVWQLNDPWPGLTWSLIDYDHRPKASYHFLQRAYRPVLASFRVDSGTLELWVTNSGASAVQLDLSVEVAAFSGSSSTRDQVAVTSAAGSSQVVWRGPVPDAQSFAWVSASDGAIAPNRAFFAPLKTLPLTGTVEGVATRTGATTATVELTSHGYSYLARVHTPWPQVHVEPNYLDLRDGDRVQVSVTDLPEDADLDLLSFASFGSVAAGS
jgi:beta-mannosidase